MRIFENPSIDFVSKRRLGYVISGVLLLAGIISLSSRGVQYAIDFTGGMSFVVETSERLDPVEVREELTQALDSQPEVKRFGQGTSQLLVRTGVTGRTSDARITEVQKTIESTLQESFGGVSAEFLRTDVVGPRFAEDLKRGALYAILGSLLVIFLYILIRFQWRFSMGAVAAVFHDVLFTLGLFSLLSGIVPFSLQIDQAIIAAFLTIVGYSLNDTVVVFDRIREYTNLFKSEEFATIVNKSINSTLSRTFVTSCTTLLVLIVLFIFGSEILRGFSFALIVGVIVGTYSSIFVASPVMLELQLRGEAA